MENSLVLSLLALLALVPATVLPVRREAERPDTVFWAVVAVGLIGPAAYGLVLIAGPWQTGLSAALWLSVATSMVIFVFLAVFAREAWRLRPLLMGYVLLLGIIATIWSRSPSRDALTASPDSWLVVHITLSLATYGLCTLAAVAAAAAVLQERSLKRKQPTTLTRALPSVSDATSLEIRLLGLSEAVLAAGIATGLARQYLSSGQLLVFDHKTLLAFLAFAVIGLILILHHRTGLRGQRAGRVILLAYLLLTLAYPGVKFVTDVLLG